MKNIQKFKALVGIVAVLSFTSVQSQHIIKLHYLGHASFVMDYSDFNVLNDYGTSYCWGLNSPIYDIGSMLPTVMSYSHYHLDHYDESRVPSYVPYTIDLLDTLNIENLWIYPVRTCESSPAIESNTSFIFDYLGFKICHLGDAQAEIMNIADPEQQAIILEKFPEQIDVLLMTIEGVHQFIPEAEMFIDLLQPGMVVPMHYWTPEYKEAFLSYLELQNDTAGKSYEVQRLEGPGLEVMADDTIHDHIKVIGLTPYPYGETGIPSGIDIKPEINIFPNPCRDHAKISFTIPEDEILGCTVYDIAAKRVRDEKYHSCTAGRNTILLDMSSLTDGIYLVQLKSTNLGLLNAYVLRRSQ